MEGTGAHLSIWVQEQDVAGGMGRLEGRADCKVVAIGVATVVGSRQQVCPVAPVVLGDRRCDLCH